MTTLAEQVFPDGPPRDGNILRLDLVSSWESQLVGLGRLTAFLTPRLLTQSHAVDDIGLYVVFLQRHRVEVGLKLVLERTRVTPPAIHSISRLFERCAASSRSVGYGQAWDAFASDQGEYVELLNEVDSNAATFRYPVNTSAHPWPRRERVDLEHLEQAGSAFEQSLLVLVAELERLEPLPVAREEAQQTSVELVELAHWCREVLRFSDHSLGSLRAQREALGGQMGTSDRAEAWLRGEEAVHEVALALADRAQRTARRLAAAYGFSAPPAPAGLVLKSPPPLRATFERHAAARQLDDTMRWFVDEFVLRIRPLLKAVAAADRRSADWATPAARQLHLDVRRFRSRLASGASLEDFERDSASTET